MSSHRPELARADLLPLMQFRPFSTSIKILLFVALMVALGALSWFTHSQLIDWLAYIALGYLWMSMVTFMHEATHDTLFERKWQNWAFGIVTMIPLMASFVSFKEDHLEHHRYNRSSKDPDAFTMGRRGIGDFIVFYLYFVAGAVLSFLHFNLLYPIKYFSGRNWTIHVFETALKSLCYLALILWAQAHGVLAQVLELWLIPVFFFSIFNSVRFIAEHYETPWAQGKLTGTRTIISNPLHSFFWNNINYHIGHHVYPRVPCYNLVKLHAMIEPDIAAMGAIVDSSYVAVSWNALRRGPESESKLAQALARRRARV